MLPCSFSCQNVDNCHNGMGSPPSSCHKTTVCVIPVKISDSIKKTLFREWRYPLVYGIFYVLYNIATQALGNQIMFYP